MGQLKETYYGIMTPEELFNEALTNNNVPSSLLVESIQGQILDLQSELHDAHRSIENLEQDLRDNDDEVDDVKEELNTLRETIAAIVTHSEWVANEEGGFVLQQNSERFTANMEAELYIDNETGTYSVLVSPYVSGQEDVEFEAETLTEAKAVALNHVLRFLARNEIVCFHRGGDNA